MSPKLSALLLLCVAGTLAGLLVGVNAGQRGADSPGVLQAVAPVYLAVARDGNVSGEVVVEARINAEGTVTSCRVLRGPFLLGIESIEAAKRWRFVSDDKGGTDRIAQLTFIFKIAPKDAPARDLTPVFTPPYKIEVSALPPRNISTP